MSLLMKGVTKLSGLEINVSKDWRAYLIKNLGAAVDDNDAVRKAQAILQAIMTTKGDLLHRGDSEAQRLPPGVSGQYLQTRGVGFTPVWTDVMGVPPVRFITPDTLIAPTPTVVAPTVVASSAPANAITPETLVAPVPVVAAPVLAESWLLIDDGETAWTEFVATGVTSTADTTIRQIGLASARMAVADDAAVGRLATRAMPARNLSPFRFLRAWVRSSIALTAGDLDILLDDTAACVTPLRELLIPALTANTWTQITLGMGVTSDLTTIISIGIGMNVDRGVFDFWIDQVRATEGGA